MDIFIHYLDKEVLDSVVLPRNRAVVESELVNSLKIALLLCEDAVYIPFSNYCESALAKNVIDNFRDIVQFAAIKLVSSSETLEAFLQKKSQSYEIYQSSQIQEQIEQTIEVGIPGVWKQRNNSATADISTMWVDSIGDGFWEELYKLTDYKKISRFEKELSFVPRRLKGTAFVAANVLPTLNFKRSSETRAKKIINVQVTRAYIKSYLDEFKCVCFKDLFIQGTCIDHLLPNAGHNHISYNTICRMISSRTYKGINLMKWINDCSVYELFELRRSNVWQEIIQEFFVCTNKDTTKSTAIRKEVNKTMKAFIVHGHDTESKFELKDYLQNTLKFEEPCILAETPSHGKTIIEKFESLANEAAFVFVLLTPDDKYDGTNRARQNVIFELGYFLGKFGRLSGRVLLLYKGELDLPSDISGIVYINIDNGIKAAGEQIRKEIEGISK